MSEEPAVSTRHAKGEADATLVLIPQIAQDDAKSSEQVEETTGLVEAVGARIAGVRRVRVRKPTAGKLFGPGQADEIAAEIEAVGATLVVVDTTLSPVQQRNLERVWKTKVIDRTGLILEIFALRARTREGKAQVEMARLLYERSRLVRTWTHLERQRGGIGVMGGPGETQLEADRRMLDEKIRRRKGELEDIRRTRGVQRAGRARANLPIVALVGYTNAGKSSLFNRLSGGDVFVKDMPFATLDPTIKAIRLPSGRKAGLIDTVGFISDLPTHLVASFRATLEETLEADLLVHVRDISHPETLRQRDDVDFVLGSLEDETGTRLPPAIEVWNKIDRLDEDARETLRAAARSREPGDPPAVLMSAWTGEGVADVLGLIDAALSPRVRRWRTHLTPQMGRERAALYEAATILSEATDDAGGLTLTFDLSPDDAAVLSRRWPGLSLVEEIGPAGDSALSA